MTDTEKITFEGDMDFLMDKIWNVIEENAMPEFTSKTKRKHRWGKHSCKDARLNRVKEILT